MSCSGSRDIMSPPSPVSRCQFCNGHGWIPPGGNLVVATTSSSGSGPFSQVVSASSPPIRHSNNSRERFARPAPPSGIISYLVLVQSYSKQKYKLLNTI